MRFTRAVVAAVCSALFLNCADDPTRPSPVTPAQSSGSSRQTAGSCPECVLGPITYTRQTGKPVEVISSFSADPSGSYALELNDLGSQGADGSVTINGQVVLDYRTPGELGPRSVSTSIALLPSNEIKVRLTGRAGSVLFAQIRRLDAPVQNAFCGQFLDLTSAQLPLGWTQLVVRGGPGLVNDRLEGQQVDGGARIGVTSSPISLSKITIDYDALSNQSFWGTQHGINLASGSTILTIYETNAAFNFGAGNLAFRVTSGNDLWPGGSTVLVDEQVESFDPGEHHFKLEITASQVMWTATNIQTARVVTTTLAMPVGFNMAAIDGLYFHAYETTGSGTWADNINIACQ